MLAKSRSLLLATTLIVAPLATALAQHNNPTGNLGSNGSATATPGTADNSTANTGNGTHGTSMSNYGGTAMNSTTPGATGHTIVPGSTSSQASSSLGTEQQKKGAQTAGGK